MCWGVFYILSEHIYKQISVYTTLAVEAFFFFIVVSYLAIRSGALKHDLATLNGSGKLIFLLTTVTIVSIIAELSINFSISEKDATLAGFVEITYPFFIALFAYIFYRQEELHPGTAIGGALIFIGACVIFYFSR